MRTPTNVLVTGGCGFIGANFIHYLFRQADFDGVIVNLDNLTYAGNPENLAEVQQEHGGSRYFFIKGDICDYETVTRVMDEHEVDTIIHFAAESHVDRSIHGPKEFIQTNVMGTFTLLEACRKSWGSQDEVVFHHVSTDEVFGSLGPKGRFTEDTPYDPRSPYSASKASSDHLVRAYHYTYGLPITISNCSNNYGPYQFPEKLIPLMVQNLMEEKPLPVYGDGKNVRDWLYVTDHCEAIWLIVRKGNAGETYAVGGDSEVANIRLVEMLCEDMALQEDRAAEYYRKLITFVPDRPGHDRRYAIDSTKLKKQLGWTAQVDIASGIHETVAWYRANQQWNDNVKSGEYRKWLELNYEQRDS